MGRLYVCGSPNRFDNLAMDFVLQLLDHITPLMENVRLVDNLASDAAEQERHRIARDIHDSVIQPYVGLQLGIAALAQKLRNGNTNVVANVEELLELTNQELVEMRSYVRGLQAAEDRRDVLLPAINRFVTRFASVTGIHVDVKTHGKVEVNDRLAAELFQIVAEGLSNVRRHALCNEAGVEIACDGGKLMLQIKNRRPGRTGDLNPNGAGNHNEQTLFTPRSIAERAALLGGETKVSIDENNYTVVNVAIPLKRFVKSHGFCIIVTSNRKPGILSNREWRRNNSCHDRRRPRSHSHRSADVDRTGSNDDRRRDGRNASGRVVVGGA
jgi:signal transduction histidine kinase